MQPFEQSIGGKGAGQHGADAQDSGAPPPVADGVYPPERLKRRVSRLEQRLAESEQRTSRLLGELAASARKVNETKLLVREVDHRAKNSLQIAASMLCLQAAHSGDAKVRAQLAATTQRLQNLAAVHAALYESDEGENAPVRGALERVCYAFDVVGDVALSIEAPALCWPASAVRAIGLFAGEAVANALKHAFRNGRAGWLSVSLSAVERDDLWRLEIADDGDGKVDGVTEGLGLKLLHIFAQELHGRFEITSGLGGRGLAVAVVFPSPCGQERALL